MAMATPNNDLVFDMKYSKKNTRIKLEVCKNSRVKPLASASTAYLSGRNAARGNTGMKKARLSCH
jgi:hypothetical protein